MSVRSVFMKHTFCCKTIKPNVGPDAPVTGYSEASRLVCQTETARIPFIDSALRCVACRLRAQNVH